MFRETYRFKPPDGLVARLVLMFAFALGFTNTACGHGGGYPEAEVKSNIHAIQIALERYAVDSGGYYPYILYGGDSTDTFVMGNSDYQADYDALIVEGYLAQYPSNPFTRDLDKKIITNPGTSGFGPLERHFLEDGMTRTNVWPGRDLTHVRRQAGGEAGMLMWDVSEGQRHPPWPINVIPDPDPHWTGYVNPTNDHHNHYNYRDDYQFALTAGNFYYYAIFEERSDYSSFALDDQGRADIYSPLTSRPIGFHLCGYGTVFNPGNDVYNLWGDLTEGSLGTLNYILPESEWDGVAEFYVGPDGRRDGVIMVADSGVDVNTPMNQQQAGIEY